MEGKQNYIEKFKVGQRVRYVGPDKKSFLEFLHKKDSKKDNVFVIGEVINYNGVHGWYPQTVNLKLSSFDDKGECRYLLDGRWSVTESDLEAA